MPVVVAATASSGLRLIVPAILAVVPVAVSVAAATVLGKDERTATAEGEAGDEQAGHGTPPEGPGVARPTAPACLHGPLDLVELQWGRRGTAAPQHVLDILGPIEAPLIVQVTHRSPSRLRSRPCTNQRRGLQVASLELARRRYQPLSRSSSRSLRSAP